ncbi:MAG: hypothetical protein KKH08_05265 [Candidatus Omnitrophica bacterium]|nr:hypothetical protein [Candidatus Omnitrophota bacterium]
MPTGLGNKEKTEIAMICAGIIFFIFLVIGNAHKAREKERAMDKAGESISSSLLAPIYFDNPDTERPGAGERWGRDPFSQANLSDGSGLEEMVLNGIMWDTDSPYAIINSDVVKPGDMLGGMKVAEINEKNVILEENGKRHTLTLPVF